MITALSDYGLIGNHSSAALISRFGSIDWLCLPYLDSQSNFAALLDEGHGGRFLIMPHEDYQSTQNYIAKTNILETHFETPTGRALLTDWMPLEYHHDADPVLHRRLEVTQGKMSFLLTCTPRFGLGGAHTGQAEFFRGGVLFRGLLPDELGHLRGDVPLEISANGASVVAKFELESAQRAQFSWTWGRYADKPFDQVSSLKKTIEYWQSKSHVCSPGGCPFAGPWHDLVIRSQILSKTLATAYSGAIPDAVISTTFNPKKSGHCFAWVRDSAFTLQALAQVGCVDEAKNFFSWLSDIVIRDGAESLQPLYTLDGGRHLPDSSYSGYSNHAGKQFQLDSYGQVILAAWEYQRLFGALPTGLWPKIAEIADYVCQAWRRPDHRAWESGSPLASPKPQHHVFSKLLCWVALDRACKLADTENRKWENECKILHRTICEQGYDSNQHSFVHAFGDREIDSSALYIPLLGFLPFDDPRVIGTMDAIRNELSEGVFIYRFRGDPKGPSMLDSLLFTSCLALAGQGDEASDRLAELCTYATPLGLLGDQIIHSSQIRGDFPSTNVHLGLINAALYVGEAKGRQVAQQPLIGIQKPKGKKAA